MLGNSLLWTGFEWSRKFFAEALRYLDGYHDRCQLNRGKGLEQIIILIMVDLSYIIWCISVNFYNSCFSL